MPIQEHNIAFVESQVMDDVPEGGGAATGHVVVDGAMNNVFPDISDLDRAYGRLRMRKLSVAVRTLSVDLFGGVKTVITALPDDPALSYTLFSTGDAFDTRSAAANKVQAYLYKGPVWHGYLFENHIKGMTAINIIQRVGSPLPPIGKTLCIVENEGLASEREQYVRVTDIDVTETFFGWDSSGGDFSRWVVTLTLSSGLLHDFTGHSAYRYDSSINYTGRARLRNTSVADATRYYGAQRLSSAAGIGDLSLRVDSLFTQLVPSAQTETPLIDQPMAPELLTTLSAGTRVVEVAQQAHTRALNVTAESRRLNWIETLLPIPAPGALSVAFMAQGNWYVLADDGSGVLVGSDPSSGTGTISPTTGATAVSLGALPDVGSQILFTWASPTHYAVRAGTTADADAAFSLSFDLKQGPVVPGSLITTYSVGGVARTFADDGAGLITGSGVTGRINYATRRVDLAFTTLPDPGTSLSNAYTWRDGADLYSGAIAEINGGNFVVPGSVPFRNAGGWRFTATTPEGQIEAEAYLTAAGQVRVRAGGAQFATHRTTWADQPVGIFDAATGVVTLTTPGYAITAARALWTDLAKQWVGSTISAPINSVFDIAVERDTVAFNPNSINGELVLLANVGLTLSLLTTTSDTVVPNSVQFSGGGHTYEDRNGILYTNIDPDTGSGLPAGTMDYGAGKATITYWGANTAGIVVTSCLTRYGQWSANSVAFRTQSAPLKSESLSITAVARDGTVLTAAANADGAVIGAKARGSVNQEFGTGTVEFGEEVSGDWSPIEVLPETVRYSGVAYSYLPLDADILGIDPVRLPPDGRVPIYRPGDVILAMHAATTAPITPTIVSEGDESWYEASIGRDRIAWVRISDANGATVTTGYTLDRAAGKVRWSDITGLATPVTIRHTVADLRQITDASIGGLLSLARPLTHNFPARETVVASCLIHGDRRARVSALWDQNTWTTGVWEDSYTGTPATATLNTIAHPIQVTNEGCITERWLLRWTSTTSVELIGEHVGLVFSGSFSSDIAPINPATRAPDGSGGAPYLVIPVTANGGGWSAANVVRINTVGALANFWITQSIQQSDAPEDEGADGCELYCLGNIDRP